MVILGCLGRRGALSWANCTYRSRRSSTGTITAVVSAFTEMKPNKLGLVVGQILQRSGPTSQSKRRCMFGVPPERDIFTYAALPFAACMRQRQAGNCGFEKHVPPT